MIPYFSPITSEIAQRRCFLNPPCLLGIFSLSLLTGALLFPAFAAETSHLDFAPLTATTSTTSATLFVSNPDATVNADVIAAEGRAEATFLSDGESATVRVNWKNNKNDHASPITALGHYVVGCPVRAVDGEIREAFESTDSFVSTNSKGGIIPYEGGVEDKGDAVKDFERITKPTSSRKRGRCCHRLSWTSMINARPKISPAKLKKETWVAWFKLSRHSLSKVT